jgi:hypothetical protein
MATISYSHCVHATPGKLDRPPFTRYERRELPCLLFLCPGFAPGVDDEYRADAGGLSGYGDTPEDAMGDLAYRLMDRSRCDAGFADQFISLT